MRGKILNAILALSFVTVGAVATASAQLPGTRMTAEVPFDFIVGEQTLPAGTYEVRRVMEGPWFLYIQNVDDRRETAVFKTDLYDEDNSIPRSELVFHRYGDIYFLARIVSRYEGMTRELPPSKQERSMASDLASNNKAAKSESVTLAAN